MKPASNKPRSGPSSLASKTPADRLFDDLLTSIKTQKLREGERIAPIRDLASQYGTTFETARLAIARLEKMGMLQRRRGAGTFVMRLVMPPPVQHAEMPMVALMIDSKAHLMDRLIVELEDLLQARGIGILKLAWRPELGIEQLNPVMQSWALRPPKAIVVQVGPANLEQLFDKACAGKSLIINTFRYHASSRKYHSVNADYAAVARIAAEYLIKRGHKRIGYLTFRRHIRPEMPNTWKKRTVVHTPQILAIGEVVRAAGLEKGFSIHYTRNPDNQWSTDDPGMIKGAMEWFREKRPTGIIGNDFRVVGVLQGAMKLGLKIGVDIEAVGIGNTPWAQATHLSSVSLREDVIAQRIVDLITTDPKQLEGVHHNIVVSPQILSRSAPN